MKKTILQYMTDIYQEDIPKHILQENKIRLNSFFLEQESVQKKGTQFIFRYAFYSVEKPRKITKQHLLKEYAGVPLEKRSVQPEQIPDMKQYSDIYCMEMPALLKHSNSWRNTSNNIIH